MASEVAVAPRLLATTDEVPKPPPVELPSRIVGEYPKRGDGAGFRVRRRAAAEALSGVQWRMKQERAMKRSCMLAGGVLSLSVLLAAALRAEEPARKTESLKPPWQRLLQGDDAKKAAAQDTAHAHDVDYYFKDSLHDPLFILAGRAAAWLP
jgi:hypothetical protein